MNWNDCEAIWKRQPLPLGKSADVAEVRRNFDEKRRKMATLLLARDLMESGAALVVAAAIAFLWWQTGRNGWPFGLAIILVLGVGGVFVRERLRARRNRLGSDATLLAKVEADIAELQHQRQMFLRMRTWYLGPVFAASLVVSLMLISRAKMWDAARSPWFQLTFIVGYLLLGWFTWIINRREVTRRLDPRIEELELLRRDLTGTGN
jgi:hypothetical protein